MRIVASLALAAALTDALGAQCPDGSPPPCRPITVATARRVNPPLDDRTWIVLPFDNLGRSADIEWLRDASVNLLYMDMSRWRDIRVVDDERVADLLRDIPEARDAKQLSLNTGLSVARRAGAGKLVMGDLLKVGNRTQVVAKVFDVRGGQRIRSIREETPHADSLLTIFGRIAKGILNVAPPAGEQLGAVGTSSVDAYQEYLAGVKALNRFDLTEAMRRFERSLQIDSTFALAHYKLAVALGWEGRPGQLGRPHLEAASRLSTGLPPRERKLIQSYRQFLLGDYTASCEGFASLVRADSSDVEALYGLSDCLFHDEAIVPANADSTQWRFRADWNQMLAGFRRVLVLDPTYHLAFQHILDALKSEGRGGCRRVTPDKPCGVNQMFSAFVAVVRRDGDSLVTTPLRATDTRTFMEHRQEAARTSAAKRNLEQARLIAEEWLAAGPDEPRPRVELASLLLLVGRLDDAERVLQGLSANLSPLETGRAHIARYELAVKRYRGAEANRVLDSLTRLGGGRAVPTLIRLQVAMFNAVAGRLALYDSVLMSTPLPAPLKRYIRESVRLVVGFPRDSLLIVEREAPAAIASFPPFAAQAASMMQGTLLLGIRIPRPEWPKVVLESADTILGPARAAARGDTAALRLEAKRLDSTALTPLGAGEPARLIVAAEVYLMLRDSLAALERIRRVIDSVLPTVSFGPTLSSGFGGFPLLYSRAMVQRADLAAALGFRDEARLWYGRFLELWAKADPEFQPHITRIRAAYQALGG